MCIRDRAQAQQNRIDFGRSKAERERTKAEAEQATRHLDGHRLTDDDKAT